MKRIISTGVLLFTILATTGCSRTPKYKVTIDAVTAANHQLVATSYKVASHNADLNDLRTQKYLRVLDKVLAQKGYHKAKEGTVSKETIYLDYGVEKIKEETRTYTEPNIRFNLGFGYPYNSRYYRNNIFYADPFYDPFYRERYSTYQRTYRYYNRHVTILAKDQFSKELWRVDASSIGTSKNLRAILPLLIESTAPYIGTTTEVPVQVTVKAKKEKKQ